MIRKKGHQTLRDEIEKLKKDTEKKKTKGKRWFLIKLIFSLLFLSAGYFLDFLIYAVYGLLAAELMQCLLARRRFHKDKEQHKAQKQLELQIRTASETILIGYLVMVGLVISVYGSVHYILKISVVRFSVWDWLQYGFLLFLLFEVILLRYYKKFDRKV